MNRKDVNWYKYLYNSDIVSFSTLMVSLLFNLYFLPFSYTPSHFTTSEELGESRRDNQNRHFSYFEAHLRNNAADSGNRHLYCVENARTFKCETDTDIRKDHRRGKGQRRMSRRRHRLVKTHVFNIISKYYHFKIILSNGKTKNYQIKRAGKDAIQEARKRLKVDIP